MLPGDTTQFVYWSIINIHALLISLTEVLDFTELFQNKKSSMLMLHIEIHYQDINV